MGVPLNKKAMTFWYSFLSMEEIKFSWQPPAEGMVVGFVGNLVFSTTP